MMALTDAPPSARGVRCLPQDSYTTPIQRYVKATIKILCVDGRTASRCLQVRCAARYHINVFIYYVEMQIGACFAGHFRLDGRD